MHKQIFYLTVSLFFLLCLPVLVFAEESITITTYYPSPYGSYNDLYVANKLGIGTTGPDWPLHVASDSNTGLIVSNLSKNYGIRMHPWGAAGNNVNIDPLTAGAGFYFGRDVSLGQFIIQTGNVGIGTTNPTAKLHIGGTAGTDGIKFPDGTTQTTAVAPAYYTSGSVDPPTIDATQRDVMTVSFTLSKSSLVYAWYSMTGGEGSDGRMWCGMHLDDGAQNESGWVENDQDAMYTIHGSTAWANVSAGSHHVDIKCSKSGTANNPWRAKLDVITF